MEPPTHKFRAQSENESALEQQQGSQQQQAFKEWNTPEELLRHDVEKTVVPTAVQTRLKASSAGIPLPRRSWWKRWFG